MRLVRRAPGNMRDRPEPGHAGAHTLALARPSGPRVPEHVPSRRAPPPPLRRHRPATSGPGRLWAVVFWRAQDLPNVDTALYFSLATYTTIGFGDVVVGPGWRVLAGIEGLTGILLVAWSTAFVFAVVNRTYEHWRQVHSAS